MASSCLKLEDSWPNTWQLDMSPIPKSVLSVITSTYFSQFLVSYKIRFSLFGTIVENAPVF